MNPSVGALMLSAGMPANTFGKISMGFLIDHIGSTRTILLYSVLIITGCVLLLTMHGSAMMMLGAVLIGLSYSLGTVGVVMLTEDTFGAMGYEKTYPAISFGGTAGNALYSSIIGFIYDAEENYDLTLILIVVFMIIGIMCILICRQRGNRETVAETA